MQYLKSLRQDGEKIKHLINQSTINTMVSEQDADKHGIKKLVAA